MKRYSDSQLKLTLLVGLWAWAMPFLTAQPTDSTAGNASLSNLKPTILFDTITVHFRYLHDSTLYSPQYGLTEFENYNPLRQPVHSNETYVGHSSLDFAPSEQNNLGNYGSAGVPTIYKSTLKRGIRLGVDNYDAYILKPSQLRFYEAKYPVTELFYTRAGKTNDNVRALFGFSFSKQWAYSIYYNLINQAGFYAGQNVRHQNIGLGVRYRGKNDKYSAVITFVTNLLRERANGGIADIADVTGKVPAFANAVVVQLPSASTTVAPLMTRQNYEFRLSQTFRVGRDSTKFNGELRHDLAWIKDAFVFHDANSQATNDFYGSFETNVRGLRVALSDRRLHNSLLYEQHFSKWLSFQAGAEHEWHFITQTPETEQLQTLYLTGGLSSAASRRVRFDSKAWLGLAGRPGEYAIQGALNLDFGKIGHLQASLLNQLYSPALIEQRLYVSQASVWQHDFSPTKTLNLAAAYTLPFTHTSIGVGSHTIGNPIWYDATAQAQQSGVSNIFQVWAKQAFHFGIFNAEGQFVWQKVAGDAVFRLPEWWLKTSAYLEGHVFKKKMLLRFGGNMRLQADTPGYAYMPLTSQFYLHNEAFTLAPYPLLDVYASFKVQRFRVFVMGENMLQDVYKRAWFGALYQPMPYRVIRFGVSWQLGD